MSGQEVKQVLTETAIGRLIRERIPSNNLETEHPVRFLTNGGRTWKRATPGLSENEHHAMGDWLNYIKAIAIAYRYGRYAKRSKIGGKFDRLIKAVDELREALTGEYGWVVAANLLPQGEKEWGEIRHHAAGSSVYYNREIFNLWDFVIEELLSGPPDRALRSLGIPIEEYRDQQHARFQRVVKKAVLSTHVQAQKLPILWDSTARALPPPTAAKTDRYTEGRLNLRG